MDNVVFLFPDKDKLPEFDQRVVETVENLMQRAQEANQRLVDEGMTVINYQEDIREHPLVNSLRVLSAELRGWVKERPDLFGSKDTSGVATPTAKLAKYK